MFPLSFSFPILITTFHWCHEAKSSLGFVVELLHCVAKCHDFIGNGVRDVQPSLVKPKMLPHAVRRDLLEKNAFLDLFQSAFTNLSLVLGRIFRLCCSN